MGSWYLELSLPHLTCVFFSSSGLIECSLYYLWLCQPPPAPRHYITSRYSLISSVQKGPSVGLNLALLAHLAHVSPVVQAFRRENDPLRGALAAHLVVQSCQLDGDPEEFRLFRMEAFIALYERLSRSVSGIGVWSVVFSFHKWEALPIHLILCKAYFSLVSLVRAEWDGPGIQPRWWRFMKWPSCKYLTVLWCCPCQMSALNNSDYTSHSLHSWRNRSMWHLDTAAALVSFSSISFEGSFFFFL